MAPLTGIVADPFTPGSPRTLPPARTSTASEYLFWHYRSDDISGWTGYDCAAKRAMDTCAPTRSDVAVSEIGAVIWSESMRKLMRMAERVARSGAAVLITGETGSGKELVARTIHAYSLRCNRPWIDLNCAALPETLIESELFGYEKGAFSGAHAPKPGLFELADKGTLFLDEIGELEPKTQVKLLRVLDNMPYFRVGGSRKISVDVRVIAATNQDLEAAVRVGRFRSDLYHRLNQFQLRVPPLRERPDDIIALAEHFLRQNNPAARLAPDALGALRAYPWPGNVRELRNLILKAVTLADSEQIHAEDLPLEAPADVVLVTSGVEAGEFAPVATDLAAMEREAIKRALQRSGGHQGRAADQLGISRRTLSRKLKQYTVAGQAPPQPLGRMSQEEHNYFRAGAEGPAVLMTKHGEIDASLVNVSAHGVSVQGIENPFQCVGELGVRFTLPGTSILIDAKGILVWADPRGRVGINLTDMPRATQKQLSAWLTAKQKEEGWDLTSLPGPVPQAIPGSRSD